MGWFGRQRWQKEERDCIAGGLCGGWGFHRGPSEWRENHAHTWFTAQFQNNTNGEAVFRERRRNVTSECDKRGYYCMWRKWWLSVHQIWGDVSGVCDDRLRTALIGKRFSRNICKSKFTWHLSDKTHGFGFIHSGETNYVILRTQKCTAYVRPVCYK